MENIEVVGVYPVEVTKRTLLANARLEFGDGRFYLDDLLYDTEDDEFTERFKDIYLVEVVIDDVASDFDPGSFTQEIRGRPRDSWQVAYDEKYLDLEGLSVRPIATLRGRVRLAFFFHSPDLDQPLLTQYGPVRLPKPTAMPERLKQLFRYVPPC